MTHQQVKQKGSMFNAVFFMLSSATIFLAGAYTTMLGNFIFSQDTTTDYWVNIILGSGGVAAALIFALRYMYQRNKSLEKENKQLLHDRIDELKQENAELKK